MFLFVILFFLVVLVAIRISNNNDLINTHSQNEQDLANIANAKKVFRRSKTSNYILLGTILLLAILLLCNFTDLDYKIIDYVAIDIVEEPEFNNYFYFVPVYLLVIREIFIQVKIGEFLLKFFKVEEQELNIKEEVLEPLKSTLYKKVPQQNIETSKINEQKKDEN